MKVDKKATAVKQQKEKSRNGGKAVVTTPRSNQRGATAKVRANSGRGLNNEGTTTTYEGERRNG